MRVLLGQAGSITIAMDIAITWIGKVMGEREVIKEETTRVIETEIMRMNGCQQERERANQVDFDSFGEKPITKECRDCFDLTSSRQCQRAQR